MRITLHQKIYVSGPISNSPNHINEFNSAVRFLQNDGHTVLNPLDIKVPSIILSDRAEWVYYMKEAIKMLMDAECIYMLEGWEGSEVARVEHNLATELDIPVHYEGNDHKYV